MHTPFRENVITICIITNKTHQRIKENHSLQICVMYGKLHIMCTLYYVFTQYVLRVLR